MSKHRLVDFQRYEPATRFTRSMLDDLRRRSVPESAIVGGLNTFDFTGHGWRRVFVVPVQYEPEAGAPANVIVIDDTQDYRDRILLLTGQGTQLAASDLATAYPGAEDDASFATLVDTPRLYYTGSGYPTPTAANDDRYCAVYNPNRYNVLYARDTDGALVMATLEGLFVSRLAHAFQVLVSPKAGERALYTAPAFDGLDGGDGTAVLPSDLNNLQDEWVMQQMPPSDATFALGKLTEGHTPLALEHTVRGETIRQPLTTPALQRWAFVEATGSASILIDDRQDWRDRYVHLVGNFSTSDIRPGQASENLNGSTGSASTGFDITFYTGEGDNEDGDAGYIGSIATSVSGAFFYVDADTGHLYISMIGNATTRYMNLWFMASPQTGLRSQATETTELDEPADAVPPTGRLVDSISDLGTEGPFARIRADRGVVNVGGRVAAVGDQTGNGNHIIEPVHAARPGLPVPVEGAKGQFGFVHSAVDENDEDGRLRFGAGLVTRVPDWTGYLEGVQYPETGSTFRGLHAMHVGTIDADTIPYLLYDFNSGPTNLEIGVLYNAGTFQFLVVQGSGGTPWILEATPASYSLGEPYAIGIDIEYQEGIGFVPTMAVRTQVDGLTVASVTQVGDAITGAPNTWELVASAYMNGHTFEVVVWRESLGAPDAAISSAYVSNRYGV